MNAVAYVNHGRWVCDCPRPFCGNAIRLEPRQSVFHCAPPSGCDQLAPIDWPPDADDITEALGRRPVPTTRNWAPAGHRQARACGVPDGQTVADLIAETRDHQEGACV